MPKHSTDWESVLSAAARLQTVLPEAVLVGGTAAAFHVGHRTSYDADHVISDLKHRYEDVLSQLESVAGWVTSRISPPVQILGSLDGIMTGVRQLIRQVPLETVDMDWHGLNLKVPTEAEILRIKAVLILKRNASRDYLDFAALSNHMGTERAVAALDSFDRLYPQQSGESALQQLLIQIASPMPFDLDKTGFSRYKGIVPQWKDWDSVFHFCSNFSVTAFRLICKP